MPSLRCLRSRFNSDKASSPRCGRLQVGFQLRIASILVSKSSVVVQSSQIGSASDFRCKVLRALMLCAERLTIFFILFNDLRHCANAW